MEGTGAGCASQSSDQEGAGCTDVGAGPGPELGDLDGEVAVTRGAGRVRFRFSATPGFVFLRPFPSRPRRAQPGRRLKTCDASCARRPHL